MRVNCDTILLQYIIMMVQSRGPVRREIYQYTTRSVRRATEYKENDRVERTEQTRAWEVGLEHHTEPTPTTDTTNTSTLDGKPS